jgi:ADP-heptose:LPS heptosyltransferase
MGDVAMTVPVILALTRAYPDLELLMLSQKRFQHLFTAIPQVQFIEADLEVKHKGVKGMYKLSKWMEEQKIDAIADIHNVLRSKILRIFLYNIDNAVIDKGRADKKRLVHDTHFFEPLPHTTERYTDVFRKLGFEFTLKHDEFLPKKELTTVVLRVTGSKQKRWIGVAPFAAHQMKSLKVNRAKKLVKQLSELEDVQILLFGGGSREIKKLQLVAATTQHVALVAGKLDFEQELSLISNLDAMIAMDSGNGHLAALYNVPVITLWGNTHPYAGFAPYAQPEANQIRANRTQYPLIPTSVFGNKKVDGYKKVTNTIKIKTVINRVKEVINVC